MAVIIKKQEKIGVDEKEDCFSCVWFSWNLPWLPVTKFYEVVLRIGSLALEYDREDGDYEKMEAEGKAKLAAMVEQNENTGKNSLFNSHDNQF